MPKSAKPPVTEDLPLYIRWSPEEADYGVELRLDLVSTIAAQVKVSRQSGTELGGFLIGNILTTPAPTLRIEDVEMVSTGLDDSTVFLPEPSSFRSLQDSGDGAKQETGVIGFFRTHVRMGPMRPSLGDRSILAQDLQSGPYLVLLIRAQIPNLAAFFIANDGQLPDEPSVREFSFDENEFKALPEVSHAEATDLLVAKEPRTSSKLGIYIRIAALLLIAVGACALMWSFARQPNVPRWFGSGSQLHLALAPENNRVLKISWSGKASELNQASGATLVIREGTALSEVQLGTDDLRLGTVEYQSNAGRVHVRLTVNNSNGPVTSETANWPAM